MWSNLHLFAYHVVFVSVASKNNIAKCSKSTHQCYPSPSHNNQDQDFYLAKPKSRRDLLARSPIAMIGVSLSLLQVGAPEIANAISSKEVEASYNQYASNYDSLDGGSLANSLGIDQSRSAILRNYARGRVLEIGVGTGLNLDKYKFASANTNGVADGVTSLTLVDISDGMMSEAKEKLNSFNIPPHVEVQFIKADATQDLNTLFGDSDGSGSKLFDTVVDTFSLCVMGNEGAKRCLEQLKSVVKKDEGRILLIENTRSSNAVLGWYQDLTAEAASKMGGKGCISNQDVGSMIRSIKGLDVLEEQQIAAGVFRSFVISAR